jgi:hypothetical protein
MRNSRRDGFERKERVFYGDEEPSGREVILCKRDEIFASFYESCQTVSNALSLYVEHEFRILVM